MENKVTISIKHFQSALKSNHEAHQKALDTTYPIVQQMFDDIIYQKTTHTDSPISDLPTCSKKQYMHFEFLTVLAKKLLVRLMHKLFHQDAN
jgi:hypothetical protein